MTIPTTEILIDRAKIHGDFGENARLSQIIKELMHQTKGWKSLSMTQREALEMIACKISRLLSGDPHYADHWNDIAGYALLITRDQDSKPDIPSVFARPGSIKREPLPDKAMPSRPE